MKSPSSFRSCVAAGAAAVGLTLALAPSTAASATTSVASAAPRPHVAPRATAVVYVSYGTGSNASFDVNGSVTGASKGYEAVLYCRSFPFSAPATECASEALNPNKSGEAEYSFIVRPEVATSYRVKLEDAGKVITQTSPETIYVVAGMAVRSRALTCIEKTCTGRFTLYRFIPSSVASAELAKPWYDYLGVSFSTGRNALPPKWLKLRSGWKVSKTTPVAGHANEYQTTFNFSFVQSARAYAWKTNACTIDSESADGFGLPGHHGCSDPKVRANVTYLG